MRLRFFEDRDKSLFQNNLRNLATDPSHLDASRVGYVPTGTRPPRSFPAGRLDCDRCASYFYTAPKLTVRRS